MEQDQHAEKKMKETGISSAKRTLERFLQGMHVATVQEQLPVTSQNKPQQPTLSLVIEFEGRIPDDGDSMKSPAWENIATNRSCSFYTPTGQGKHLYV